MKTLTAIVGGIMLIMAGFIGFFIGQQPTPTFNDIIGGVPMSSEYHSTVIKQGSGTGGVLTTYPSTLGSVVVTEAMAGTLWLYNATTTNAGLRATAATSSLTAVGVIETGALEGTYTFDAIAKDGLIYSMDTVSTSTITWR